ncbi:MAG: D-alanyl-D-alanine carboxypeptidase family protein [Eubacterium sp.]|nr:D-alanyl-D-alanine carboxypeptidase family protein [Eubacterium sp.]
MAKHSKNLFARKSRAQQIRELVVVILLLLAIAIVCLFLYFNLFGTAKRYTLVEDLTAEIGSEVKGSDFVASIDGGTITQDCDVDTSTLGKKRCELTFDFDGKERSYGFDVEVVDTEAPVIKAGDDLNLLIGSSFDPAKQAGVKDNSGEKPEITVTGDYDTNKAGSYEITFSAQDSAGNKAEASMTLHVIDPAATDGDITFVTATGAKGERVDGITTIDGLIIANKTFGLPEYYGSEDLTGDTYEAYYEMASAAAEENLWLDIVSGYRSYWTQAELYEGYAASYGYDEADTFSARPGFSEHQTGYAMDLNQVDESFADTPEGIWLAENCWRYGFILRYPEGKQDITGYIPEAWHFRYIGDVELAEKLYNGGDWICLEEYFGIPSAYAEDTEE